MGCRAPDYIDKQLSNIFRNKLTLLFPFQRPLHERHNGSERLCGWNRQTVGSSKTPRYAGKDDLIHKNDPRHLNHNHRDDPVCQNLLTVKIKTSWRARGNCKIVELSWSVSIPWLWWSSGWFNHPATEEDQHERGSPLSHQRDLSVHLHRPCHHCKVKWSLHINSCFEWPLSTRYEGKKKKDKVKIVEVSWNWLPIKAQASWFFSWKKFLHLATCDLTSWPNCDQFKNYQLHAEPSRFILSYFF